MPNGTDHTQLSFDTYITLSERGQLMFNMGFLSPEEIVMIKEDSRFIEVKVDKGHRFITDGEIATEKMPECASIWNHTHARWMGCNETFGWKKNSLYCVPIDFTFPEYKIYDVVTRNGEYVVPNVYGQQYMTLGTVAKKIGFAGVRFANQDMEKYDWTMSTCALITPDGSIGQGARPGDEYSVAIPVSVRMLTNRGENDA